MSFERGLPVEQLVEGCHLVVVGFAVAVVVAVVEQMVVDCCYFQDFQHREEVVDLVVAVLAVVAVVEVAVCLD